MPIWFFYIYFLFISSFFSPVRPSLWTSFFQGYRFACYDVKPDHRYEDSLVFKLNRLIYLSLLRLTESVKWPEVEPSHLSLYVPVSCWNLVSLSYYCWRFLPLVVRLCWLGVLFFSNKPLKGFVGWLEVITKEIKLSQETFTSIMSAWLTWWIISVHTILFMVHCIMSCTSLMHTD